MRFSLSLSATYASYTILAESLFFLGLWLFLCSARAMILSSVDMRFFRVDTFLFPFSFCSLSPFPPAVTFFTFLRLFFLDRSVLQPRISFPQSSFSLFLFVILLFLVFPYGSSCSTADLLVLACDSPFFSGVSEHDVMASYPQPPYRTHTTLPSSLFLFFRLSSLFFSSQYLVSFGVCLAFLFSFFIGPSGSNLT